MTPDEVAAFVERGRAEQGLPPRVQDPTVAARVATIVGTRRAVDQKAS